MKRVREEFVPVALKAALVNGMAGRRDDPESRLILEIGRSRPAPQGIAIANPAGKVLTWALMFEGRKALLSFLDRGLSRFRDFPDAGKPVAAERFFRFPVEKMEETPDSGETLGAPAAHAEGDRCPSAPARRAGTLVCRVVGRALDAEGRLAADTTRQENYVEDLFDVPPEVGTAFAGAARAEGRLPVPPALCRLLVEHAYLGQLDVRPVSPPVPGHREDLRRCEFTAERVAGPAGATRLRVTGRTEAFGEDPRRDDGASFRHEVRLDWEGYADVAGGRLASLVLLARGRERLRWGAPSFGAPGGPSGEGGPSPLAHLPGGRPLSVDAEVRFGISGSPVPESEAVAAMEEGEAGVPDPAAGPLPRARDVQRKAREFGEGLDALLRSGRIAEAEKVLDRALEALRENPRLRLSDPGSGAPPPPELAVRLEGKMKKLHERIESLARSHRDPSPVGDLMREFQPLLAAGKLSEAEALLDQALARADALAAD
ncbi:MAG: hypothetical protein L0216_14865 [Planctomycetales bacterium]|nr:hypothetical protein [Planctomycetales bacterium]